jgi:small neutral amino acid transporter SnatA (MarC family)
VQIFIVKKWLHGFRFSGSLLLSAYMKKLYGVLTMKSRIIALALVILAVTLVLGGCRTTKRHVKNEADFLGVTLFDDDQYNKMVR